MKQYILALVGLCALASFNNTTPSFFAPKPKAAIEETYGGITKLIVPGVGVELTILKNGLKLTYNSKTGRYYITRPNKEKILHQQAQFDIYNKQFEDAKLKARPQLMQ